MNGTCDILANQGAIDAYGQRSNQVQDFVVIATVPCYVSTDAPGRPHEYVVEKESSVDWTRVFMRPPALPGGEPLTPHHWLRIENELYNVFNILNPGLLDHHYEVVCKVVTA